MKQMLTLALAILPLLVSAQSAPAERATNLELSTLARAFTFGLPVPNYETVKGERVVYSGIVVQLFRAPQPFHLINPWAPAVYGSGEQNLMADPVTRRPVGWKFFAISF
jgi:hypothetical protein